MTADSCKHKPHQIVLLLEQAWSVGKEHLQWPYSHIHLSTCRLQEVAHISTEAH